MIVNLGELQRAYRAHQRIATDDGGFRERVRASSSNQRFLFVEGCPAFVAKNRYAMPAKIAIPADFDIAELTKHWKGQYP